LVLLVFSSNQVDICTWLVPMKYFTKEDLLATPSRKHKTPQDEEFRCRARAVAFILRCGHQMKLKYTTMTTAAIYFHTFYFRRSLKVHDKYDIATACLYFASKCEEDRKRVIDVMETAYYFKYNKKAPNPRLNAKAKAQSEEECAKIRDKELILLQTLEFDFDVEQPFDYFPLILSVWREQSNLLPGLMANNERLEIIQFYFKIAWFFVYDALKLVNIVMNASEHIALACVELAIRYVEKAFVQQQNSHSDGGQDFDFNDLAKRTHILPHEIFKNEVCLLKIAADWYLKFDSLLTATVMNELCEAILDICDLENTKSSKSHNRNPMYVDKTLLKRPRTFR